MGVAYKKNCLASGQDMFYHYYLSKKGNFIDVDNHFFLVV